ncbi:carboxypeptidase-like regulatory domain-containing protein [uncultured Formosa sp.]|uniref:TonB-dependent receptor n=1 Tax=uncultured Formosa sp. TaxID=255435 RepID=UPI0026202D8A|nr:carboxypeptidase-like regulatory domain-containing protein [uncultured Formosa sp.]
MATAYAQQITLSGTVKDSLHMPLEYANILAVPDSTSNKVRFSITDNFGFYRLNLESHVRYTITVSHLGHEPQYAKVFSITENIKQNFIMPIQTSQLDQVDIAYTPPISIKSDTISYRADSFVTGEERKLRDVLKKLPGIEVDRDGKVTANGKPVSKVLVENKTFFTGGTKLAINNLPADAIDRIELLDNYTDVAMLKNLQNSEILAMNIKLKENKKQFWFGDLEAGGGVKDRYVVHPTLFYYSPESTFNFIGDFNNTGHKSFTFRDYVDFEGGYSKLNKQSGSYYTLSNDDFSTYLKNEDYKAHTNQFGALNVRRALTPLTDLSAYVIVNNATSETQRNTTNAYLNNDTPFTEDRITTSQLQTFFTIGKITLDYDPSANEDLALSTVFKIANSTNTDYINTNSIYENNTINTESNLKQLFFNLDLRYTRKFSKNHTATLEMDYNFSNDKPLTDWRTDEDILEGLIPLETDTVYTILQTKKVNIHAANAVVKDYWVLNEKNHVYTTLGTQLAFSNLYSNNNQLLSNGTLNNFDSAGFGNDFTYQFIDNFIGMEYKFQLGIATLKPGIFYHFYFWNTQQQYDLATTRNTNLLLPQFNAEIKFSNGNALDVGYNLNAQFQTVEQLASRYVLSSFNSVFKGNEQLEHDLYHRISFRLSKYSTLKGLNYSIRAAYNKKEKQFKNVTQLDGIESVNTIILFDRPEDSWNIFGNISKRINRLRFKLTGYANYSNFYQLLNSEINKNTSKTVMVKTGLSTHFKTWPNLELEYSKNISLYRAIGLKTTYNTDVLSAALEYDFLKAFIFKIDYELDIFENKDEAVYNTFDNANATLFYQRENSPWGFEIGAHNIFNTTFRQGNSFSNYLISDSKTYIMPRMLLFKVQYKL